MVEGTADWQLREEGTAIHRPPWLLRPVIQRITVSLFYWSFGMLPQIFFFFLRPHKSHSGTISDFLLFKLCKTHLLFKILGCLAITSLN